MKTLMTIAAVSLAILPAHASVEQAWHNGSLMNVYHNPDGSISIHYAVPKPQLRGIVARGTELIDGSWRNDQLMVVASVFSPCGPVEYSVDDGTLVLEGLARVVFSDCSIANAWTHNSHLEFYPYRDEGPEGDVR